MKIQKQNPVFFLSSIILLFLVALPVFINLGKQPIRIWDEARLAINAFEMHKSGNPIVTTFEGHPDLWNTKPPLMIWLQSVSITIFGYGEFALRLPSALAAFATCILLLVFSKKSLRSWIPGILASLILVTINGYIHIHAARTGDYDALLALFTSGFLLTAFLYAETNQQKFLHLFYFFVTLAILAKGVQGLIFIPAILLYFGIQKKLKWLFLNKWFYIDMLLLITVAGGYYFLRELFNPGYLQAVWENELGGRYLSTIEENVGGKRYYWRQMRYFLFTYWFWFVPFGFVAGYLLKNVFRRLAVYLALTSGFYFVVISISQTKLEWYAVPLYPLLSILVAMAIYFLIIKVHQIIKNKIFKIAIPVVLILILFARPYSFIFLKSYEGKEYEWDESIYPLSYVLQQVLHDKLNLDKAQICYEGYNTHLLAYTEPLNKMGRQFILSDVNMLAPGDIAMASQEKVKRQIENNFQFRLVQSLYGATIYNIIGPKTVLNN